MARKDGRVLKNKIINSLLDQDFYKFSMQQFFHYYENDAVAKYRFVCRTPNIDFTDCFAEIKEELLSVCDVVYQETELAYMSKIKYMKPNYIRFLSGFRLRKEDITINLLADGKLDICVEGPMIYAMMWEMPILCIVNEVYFRHKCGDVEVAKREGTRRFMLKREMIKNFFKETGIMVYFIEFGTRRRFSMEWQRRINLMLKQMVGFYQGTSNVLFSMENGTVPKGTMAHEAQQAFLGFTAMDKALPLFLHRWLNFYEGAFGTALTDTFTTDYFLSKFNGTFARAFDGLRQDSGDPMEWTHKIVAHYNKLGIDPASKLLIYSDGLNIPTVLDIALKTKGLKVSFGIGTNWTNDVGYEPLNIVVKMVECNGMPTIKISDSAGKCICEDDEFKKFALKHFQRKNI